MDLVARVQAAPTSDDVEIIDIKTSEKRPPMPQHENQLRLYGEAARVMGMNPFRLTIHDLDSDHGAAVAVEADDKEHGIGNRSFAARTGRGYRACDFRVMYE